MPPKHRQPNAPRPKPAGNVYKALVDLPHDGSDPFTDGRDGKVDGSDGKSAVNAPQRISAAETTAAASTQPPPNAAPDHSWHERLAREATAAYIGTLERGPENTFEYSAATLVAITDHHYHIQECLQATDDFLRSQSKLSDDFIYKNFQTVNRKLNLLLEKVDTVVQENTALREAHEDSRKEKAVLQAAVDNLTRKLDEHTTISAPPSPEITASSTTMEEMTMQLSVVQHDIQDVLAAVRNPPGKRKRHTRNQDAEPTMPTNRRPANNRQRAASPEHSLMHSQHATSAAQDALDALLTKYPLRPLATTSTEATTDPLPDSPAVQDTTLPDAPTTTAPAEDDGWKTVKGMASRKKRRNDTANNKQAATTASKTPTTKNGGRGKTTHQPRTNTPSAKKTWAEVAKSGGINVQIVLGNGNLGLTTPTKRRGERRGGAARRLGKKAGAGERREEGRGIGGPKVTGGDGTGTKGCGVERGAESGGGGGLAAL
jgi:hypothetical protein